jgi:hypothetical protein
MKQKDPRKEGRKDGYILQTIEEEERNGKRGKENNNNNNNENNNNNNNNKSSSEDPKCGLTKSRHEYKYIKKTNNLCGWKVPERWGPPQQSGRFPSLPFPLPLLCSRTEASQNQDLVPKKKEAS